MTTPWSQDLQKVAGSVVVQSGGDVNLGHAVITVSSQERPERGAVTATVAAFYEPRPQAGWTMRSPMRHEGSLLDSRVSIQPAHAYLDLLQSGAVLAPLEYEEREWVRRVIPARLDIKVVNNTADTVTAHQVRLDVARSLNHIRSIPVVQIASAELEPRAKVRIHGPVNFVPNWPSSATLRFRLESPRRAGYLHRSTCGRTSLRSQLAMTIP
jgi:hypothetical protein